MSNHHINHFAGTETTCGSLLCELQKIWDEVGESDVERDQTIMEIEQECLAVYKRKIDEAKTSRAQLQRVIALSESEIADICSSLGEQPVNCDRKASGNLKENLKVIIPQLEDVRKRMTERKNQFAEVLSKLQEISSQIYTEENMHKIVMDETDLSVKRLEGLHKRLVELQIEKRNRLTKVEDLLSNLNSLCLVLGVDFKDTICKVHPSLDDSTATKDVTNSTIEKLAAKIRNFQDVKIRRMLKLQDLAASLVELWSLMDTPVGEQQMFEHVTKNIAASDNEITEPNLLSMKNIKYVEGEVSRLEQLKLTKLNELVLKKRSELEEICKKTHMITEVLGDSSIKAIESGSVEPMYVLEQLELQIDNVKAEAFSRKEILDKVEKWVAAREEECWLEEYNRDDNRYNAGRGSHLTLKRAERARALVNKIPAMLESLTSKVTAWEKERDTQFLYDGVRLLSMLEEYTELRQEKEQERQRQRDQKKLKGQSIADKEALYGSKLSPSKSGMKTSRTLSGTSNRKLSLGGEMLHNLKSEKASVRVHSNKKFECLNRNSPLLNHQQSGGFAVCSGRRTSEIAGHLVKKPSSGAAKAPEVESQLVRKPLSPIPLAISSKANIANFLEDHKRTQNETLQKPLAGSKTVAVTPSKSTWICNEENKTPRTIPIPVSTTPSTITVPMLMAMTPTTPSVSFGAKAVKKIVENVEFSFEEVRAGFNICP